MLKAISSSANWNKGKPVFIAQVIWLALLTLEVAVMKERCLVQKRLENGPCGMCVCVCVRVAL